MLFGSAMVRKSPSPTPFAANPARNAVRARCKSCPASCFSFAFDGDRATLARRFARESRADGNHFFFFLDIGHEFG